MPAGCVRVLTRPCVAAVICGGHHQRAGECGPLVLADQGGTAECTHPWPGAGRRCWDPHPYRTQDPAPSPSPHRRRPGQCTDTAAHWAHDSRGSGAGSVAGPGGRRGPGRAKRGGVHCNQVRLRVPVLVACCVHRLAATLHTSTSPPILLCAHIRTVVNCNCPLYTRLPSVLRSLCPAPWYYLV